MSKIVRHTKKVNRFLKKDLWYLDLEEFSKAKARFFRYLKVLIITIKTFSTEKIGFQAVALSFFCTMAVVPFVAVMFAITGGFGLSDRLRELLYSYFYNFQDLIDNVLIFAQNIIDTAQSSLMGLISALIFVWLVIWMMMSVERVFNNVWRVQTSRNIFKRFGYYIMILLISPFIVMMFFSGSLIYSHALQFLGLDADALSFVSWVLFAVFAVFTFSAMYKFIPNSPVKYANAIRAAMISGVAFTIMQYLYLETQVFVTRINAIYGAFAAIPLFMLWLNIGWFIILIGAELSYAFQHVDEYNIDD